MKANGPDQAPGNDEPFRTRASLLARLKNLGDEGSWREFFDTYHGLIYRTVIRRGLRPDDAEEIVQEIVAGVARRMPAFIYDPERCSFKTWLFRIVANRVASHFRRVAHGLPRADLGSDPKRLLDEIPDPATLEPDEGWEQAWMQNQTQAALDRVRRRANPRYMQIYLYSEIEGHSVAETARHLQTTENDVSVARHRIRAMLREEGERLLREERRRERALP
jgi:RNA polymerase sigma-70 factor (ECF subfamily)